MKRLEIPFVTVSLCPLCGGRGIERASLLRTQYYFGRYAIPLPSSRVHLLACVNCQLLFKSEVPDAGAFGMIMASEAARVWRSKSGPHPAVPTILRYLPDRPLDILDIGASNGDLLFQLGHLAGRLSALDIERFPRCQLVVTGEYILGEVEKPFVWSGLPYGLVTAFDVFEHFRDPCLAMRNILALTAPSGRIMIETGDWTTAADYLGNWYYTNLFEHHVFWSRPTFEHVCANHSCRLLAYEIVEHKGRRALPLAKQAVLAVLTLAARFPRCAAVVQAVCGRDPTLFGQPGARDHAFVVLDKIQGKDIP